MTGCFRVRSLLLKKSCLSSFFSIVAMTDAAVTTNHGEQIWRRRCGGQPCHHPRPWNFLAQKGTIAVKIA
jgi:hypothetical protein